MQCKLFIFAKYIIFHYGIQNMPMHQLRIVAIVASLSIKTFFFKLVRPILYIFSSPEPKAHKVSL